MTDQVEEIKQKTDIVSIIGERLELKKAGRNWKALCPFHQEKTPSFMVSPELQIYRCFGCGEAGDVFSFLEKYEGMTFLESLRFLADRSGIKLKSFHFAGDDKKDRILALNDFAARFYNYVLLEHKLGKKALSYLTEKRGLKLETVKKFSLGFSPAGGQALVNFLTKKKGFTLQELVDSGTFYRRGNFFQDRFAGRVIFPLYDHRGNTVGFGGRVLPTESGESKDEAKYINSPETLVYKKSRILFGLNLIKEEIKKEGFAVVVEGELDMISSFQAGVKNVVAVKGSALTEEQVELLSRFTEKLVFAYDTDNAGIMAIKRGLVVAQKKGMEIRVAKLGGYKDPDEMARSNPEGLKRAVAEAVPVWDFLIDLAFFRSDSKTGEGKARISKELVPLLATIPDKIVQAHYIEEMAERLIVPAMAVFEEVSKGKSLIEPRFTKVTQPEEKKIVRTRRELLEERLLALLFQGKPEDLRRDDLGNFLSQPVYKRLVADFKEKVKKGENFDPALFSGQIAAELSEAFSSLMLYDLEGLLTDKDKFKKEVLTVKKALEKEIIKDHLLVLKEKMVKAEKAKEKTLLNKLEKKFAFYTARLSALNRENGVV